MTSEDLDLAIIVEVWPSLFEEMRKAIAKMITRSPGPRGLTLLETTPCNYYVGDCRGSDKEFSLETHVEFDPLLYRNPSMD